MGKTRRKWLDLDFASANGLRAQDIPYDASNSIKDKLDSIGLGNVPGLAPGRASQWGMLQVQKGALPISMAESGLCEASQYVDSGSSNVSVADGTYFKQSNGNARLNSNITPFLDFLESRHNPMLIGKIMVADSTAGLAFGFATTVGNVAGANNPAGSYCTVQYRSARDTNFQLMTKDGTTQNLVDTGIAVVTGAVHYFVVDFDFVNSLATLSVYDNTYTLQATVTSAVNLPASTTSLNWEHQQGASDLRTFFIHLVTRSA